MAGRAPCSVLMVEKHDSSPVSWLQCAYVAFRDCKEKSSVSIALELSFLIYEEAG